MDPDRLLRQSNSGMADSRKQSYTASLHDAAPLFSAAARRPHRSRRPGHGGQPDRSGPVLPAHYGDRTGMECHACLAPPLGTPGQPQPMDFRGPAHRCRSRPRRPSSRPRSPSAHSGPSGQAGGRRLLAGRDFLPRYCLRYGSQGFASLPLAMAPDDQSPCRGRRPPFPPLQPHRRPPRCAARLEQCGRHESRKRCLPARTGRPPQLGPAARGRILHFPPHLGPSGGDHGRLHRHGSGRPCQPAPVAPALGNSPPPAASAGPRGAPPVVAGGSRVKIGSHLVRYLLDRGLRLCESREAGSGRPST